MLNKLPLRTKSFRKAFLLMGVYAMHLVFFQALMQAAPRYNSNNSFRPLFTHAATNSNQAPKHPAVTYYSMLVKQQGNEVGISNDVTPVLHQLRIVLAPVSSAITVTFNLFQAGFTKLHLAEDTFKLYRLTSTFLI